MVDPAHDPVLRAVADCQRRCILYCLDRSDDGVVSFSRVVDFLQEHDPTTHDEDVIASNLHHKHLPRLEDAGWIQYDTRSETVRYRVEPEREDLLKYVENWESRAE